MVKVEEKWNPCIDLVGIYVGEVTVKNNRKFPKEIKNEPYELKTHLLVCMQEKLKKYFVDISAFPCSLQNYFLYSR